MDELVQQFWREIYAMPCLTCGNPIGYGTWILSWTPDRRSHLHCHEEALIQETKMLNEPGLIEDAAKSVQLTIEGFKELPTWERLRLVREAKEKRK